MTDYGPDPNEWYEVYPVNEPDGEGNGWDNCNECDATAWSVDHWVYGEADTIASFDTKKQAEDFARDMRVGPMNNIASVKASVDKIGKAANNIFNHSKTMTEASVCRDRLLDNAENGITSVKMEIVVSRGASGPITLTFNSYEHAAALEKLGTVVAELMTARILHAQEKIGELSAELHTPSS